MFDYHQVYQNHGSLLPQCPYLVSERSEPNFYLNGKYGGEYRYKITFDLSQLG